MVRSTNPAVHRVSYTFWGSVAKWRSSLLADVAGDASLHATLADDAGEEDHRLHDAEADQHERQDREHRRVSSREHAIEDVPEHQR